MTTKHTPAPWLIHEISGDIVTQDKEQTICQPNSRLQSGCGEANAKLIAAAPDLLDALIEMIELCTFIASDIQSNLIDNARAAINKATGV
jgi:hypothetical protein